MKSSTAHRQYLEEVKVTHACEARVQYIAPQYFEYKKEHLSYETFSDLNEIRTHDS